MIVQKGSDKWSIMHKPLTMDELGMLYLALEHTLYETDDIHMRTQLVMLLEKIFEITMEVNIKKLIEDDEQ